MGNVNQSLQDQCLITLENILDQDGKYDPKKVIYLSDNRFYIKEAVVDWIANKFNYNYHMLLNPETYKNLKLPSMAEISDRDITKIIAAIKAKGKTYIEDLETLHDEEKRKDDQKEITRLLEKAYGLSEFLINPLEDYNVDIEDYPPDLAETLKFDVEQAEAKKTFEHSVLNNSQLIYDAFIAEIVFSNVANYIGKKYN